VTEKRTAAPDHCGSETAVDHNSWSVSEWFAPKLSRAGAPQRAEVGAVGEAVTRDIGHGRAPATEQHPELQTVRRWCLATRDAESLYEKFGYVRIPPTRIWMEKQGPKERWQAAKPADAGDAMG